jgi:hypothetical protein
VQRPERGDAAVSDKRRKKILRTKIHERTLARRGRGRLATHALAV